MKLNVLVIALAATAFGSLAANAQTTVIEERRDPAVVIESQPSTTTVTKERGGFLNTETKTKTETTGAGINGDCTSKTVHKEDLTGSKTVQRTTCD
jgi:hypothetical protein